MIGYLLQCAEKLQIPLDEPQAEQLSQYARLLLEWNSKMNLTAITEPRDIVTKHFIDSLFGSRYLAAGSSLADIGTGAGFPAVPLKIMRPDLVLLLLDSLNKRLLFLQEVVSSLGLDHTELAHLRAEEGARNGGPYREKYDAAASRAVARLVSLAEYCLPYVKVGGVFLAYKGSSAEEERKEAAKAISVLGGEISEMDTYTLPDTDIKHTLVVIQKVRSTPPKYPRAGGKPVKAPIL